MRFVIVDDNLDDRWLGRREVDALSPEADVLEPCARSEFLCHLLLPAQTVMLQRTRMAYVRVGSISA